MYVTLQVGDDPIPSDDLVLILPQEFTLLRVESMEGIFQLTFSLLDEVYPLATLDDLLLNFLYFPSEDVGPEDLLLS